MTTCVAFLRGINLGKRQMKMAELREVCDGLGLGETRTIVASGNVRFQTDAPKRVKGRLEQALKERFGFEVGVILRELPELEEMVERQPFGHVDAAADAKLFVMLFDRPLQPLPELAGVPGDYEVARTDPREIYLVGYRRPNGRYSEGFSAIEKQLPRGAPVTMRNWNTIVKALS
jgi:uncharacterized protein (DUF1697 family)